MLACVPSGMLWMNNWQVQSFCILDSHRTAVKTSGLAPPKNFYQFMIFTNIMFLLDITLYIWDIGIDVIIIRVAQQWKPKFSPVRNFHRCSQLAIAKNFCLSKCQFTNPHEHNNWFHLNFIYKLHTLGINITSGIILIFEFLDFIKLYVTSRCVHMKYDPQSSLWFHTWLIIHLETSSSFVFRSFYLMPNATKYKSKC